MGTINKQPLSTKENFIEAIAEQYALLDDNEQRARTRFNKIFDGTEYANKNGLLKDSTESNSRGTKILKSIHQIFDNNQENNINNDVITNYKIYGPDKELISYFKKFSAALNKIKDPYDPEIHSLLLQIDGQIKEILPINVSGALAECGGLKVKCLPRISISVEEEVFLQQKAEIKSYKAEIESLNKRLYSAIEMPDHSSELPDEAPELYDKWKNKPENKGKSAIDCLNEVWGKYLKKGMLYQDNLRSKNGGLDKKLMEAIRNFCKNRKIKTESIIPKKSIRLDKDAKKINKKAAYAAGNLASRK